MPCVFPHPLHSYLSTHTFLSTHQLPFTRPLLCYHVTLFRENSVEKMIIWLRRRALATAVAGYPLPQRLSECPERGRLGEFKVFVQVQSTSSLHV